MAHRFTFPKKLRLLNKKQFYYVFKTPKKYNTQQITILGRYNNYQYPRIGLIISKKYIKLANKRNKIKRIIRESFRIHQYTLPNMDFIIIIKKEIINSNSFYIKIALKKSWSFFQ